MPLLHNFIANNTLADDEAIFAIKKRDNVLITALYDQYSSPLFSYILKILPDTILAEKVLQSVFKKLLYHIDSYNKKHGSIYVWLLNLSRNEAIELLIVHYTISPVFRIEENLIKPFILKLPLLEKTIAALTYLRGLNAGSISSLLTLSANLVATKMEAVSVQMQSLIPRPQVA